MTDAQQQIPVGVDQEQDTEISLPVVELLTGRGFITGKSGSGKSNTASVVAEKLLDSALGILIVDVDGEYYGLKEEYEILHAGADDECDIVVSPEHAEKLANLALEQNVPIILDVSGYLEEETANELLLEVVKQLFAKEKRMKKPFLLVIEECHEYIPEGGGMDETGKMLIKVGKRGRKHGLGIVGISQRPADVKKDFITQCDWLCWHRLTWDNDTKVVGRILGSKYASAVEDLGDGEAFLMTDWDESIRRIQFHRKETFDAGATPGLDDFERPELKSVSSDLVGELESISDEKERRESEIADLKQELEKKDRRIADLERELEEARDLSDMADQFAQALLGKAEAPYRGGGPSRAGAERLDAGRPDDARDGDDGQSVLKSYDEAVAATEKRAQEADADESSAEPAAESGASAADGGAEVDDSGAADTNDSNGGAADADATNADAADADAAGPAPESESSTPDDVDPVTRDDVAESALRFDDAIELGTREAVIEELRSRIEALPELSRGMLRHYRREGASDPVAAHIDAGGDGDSGHAYSRHRPIRRAGLIRHAGRGSYAYAVPDLVREAYADRLDEEQVAEIVRAVERVFVPPAELNYPPDADPSEVGDRPDDGVGLDADDANADVTADGGSADPSTDAPDADIDEVESDEDETPTDPGLSDAARRFAERSER
ncbi:helicase HerA domain-containing protein [Halorubrum trapanicum]|uniref:helicase HerA domain-containing protein n=1 Tax=Halorubrum trapanicum TaxID=29284 RepID=UPI003C70271E